MKRSGLFLTVIIGFAMLGAAFGYADPYSVGEKWAYEHEGSIPWRSPDQTVDGNRTREVVAVEGEGEEKRWIIREQWGTNDSNPTKSYVDSNRKVHKVEMSEGNTISFDPPIPSDYMNLKIGDKSEVKTKFQMPNGQEVPYTITAVRVDDETIKVPAGELKCMHVKLEETFQISSQGQKIVVKSTRDHYYHQKYNGLVMEEFVATVSIPDVPKTEGKSVLKTYEKKEK